MEPTCTVQTAATWHIASDSTTRKKNVSTFYVAYMLK